MTYRKDLVEKAIQGDKEAFSMLYDEIYNDLYKMAVYMTGDATCAEDVVSDTIVDAYKGIEKSIVTLCVIEGYSSKDVGNFFGLNPNTVRSKLNRSLEKIKQSMGGM